MQGSSTGLEFKARLETTSNFFQTTIYITAIITKLLLCIVMFTVTIISRCCVLRFVLQNASRLVPSVTIDVVDKFVQFLFF